eukprot:1187646-Prorocentrum_minimum.AAC.2
MKYSPTATHKRRLNPYYHLLAKDARQTNGLYTQCCLSTTTCESYLNTGCSASYDLKARVRLLPLRSRAKKGP